MLLILTGISGCSVKIAKQPTAPTSWWFECEPYYKDRVVKELVPVRCKSPMTYCSEPLSLKDGSKTGMLKCIDALRESNNFCK